VIEFYHVFKQYVKDSFALKDVNLSIEKGEFIFLTGHSGAGKTTLLKLIYKDLVPSKGQILIDSVNVNLIPDKSLYQLRRKIGIVFQDFKLLPNRTVFENVAIPLLVRGERKNIIEKMTNNALTLFGLSHRKYYFPDHISGGEQQRVAIARAIAGNPKIIIADEPTGNLDTELSLEILQIFEKINQNGITLLIATHDNNLIKNFSKRMIKLENNTIVSGSIPDEQEVEYIGELLF
jgi:cell division transport system ATP-binding protein